MFLACCCRWNEEATAAHILDTDNHPLSEFEEALLVQVSIQGMQHNTVQ
jgi:hypothetical protein